MRILFALAWAMLLSPVTHAQVTTDSLGYEYYTVQEGNQSFTLKKYWMVFLMAGEKRSQSPEEAAKLQEGHLNHLNMLAEKGLTLMTGPMGDDGAIRGVVVYNLPTEAEVRKWAEADPAVQAGRLVVEIHPWWTAPGACLQ